MRRLALALALLLCGCHSLHDCVNQSLIDVRDHCEAHTVWKSCGKDLAACDDNPCHFGEGFREGYRAVAAGGNGCPPTLPPRKYWCVLYQNDAGRQKVVSWYNGYAAGAAAAQQNGVQERNRLVTATELYHRQCQTCPTEIVIEESTPVEPESNQGLDYFPEMLNPRQTPIPELPPAEPAAEPQPLDKGLNNETVRRAQRETEPELKFVPPIPLGTDVEASNLLPPLPPPTTGSEVGKTPPATVPGQRPVVMQVQSDFSLASPHRGVRSPNEVFRGAPAKVRMTDKYELVRVSDRLPMGRVHLPSLESSVSEQEAPTENVDVEPANQDTPGNSAPILPNNLAMNAD